MGDADRETQEVAFLVELLPDNHAPSKEFTGISTRVYERRKAFFEEQRALLSKELDIVGIDIEEKLTCCLKTLNNFIARSETELDNLVSDTDPRDKSSETHEALQPRTLSLSEFDECTKTAKDFIRKRREKIEDTRQLVENLENHRAKEITKLFDVYVPRILKGSHLLHEDACRIMEQEMLAINQVILRNRRAYIALFEQLSAQALYREKACVETFKLHRSEWKVLEVRRAVANMGEALENECRLDQGYVETLLELTLKYMEDLAWKKAGIVAELEKLVSPNVTVERCRKWIADMETVISEIYDEALEGVSEVRKYTEELHLGYFDQVADEAKILRHKLEVSEELIRFDFTEPCLFMSASRQAQFENDLQYYTSEFNTKMEEEIIKLRSLFGFSHGATWHWELHLTSVAKAETFLGTQLQKQRTLLKAQYDTKTAPKLRTILEALRRAGTPAAVATQQTAAINAAKEVDGQVRDSWKKSLVYFTSFPLVLQVLLKGYEERLCAYMQVRMKKPAIELPIETSPSNEPTPSPKIEPKPTGRRLPDILIDGEEKTLLQSFGITPVDEENLAIRMKGLPAFSDDPRPQPLTDALTTPSGFSFEPRPTSIEECFRFGQFPQAPLPKGQAAPHADPNRSLLAETESQLDMTKNDTITVSKKLGLVNLDALVDRSAISTKLSVDDSKKILARQFLFHLAEEWSVVLKSSSTSLLETKKEAFELEIQTKLRCSSLRVNVFVDAVAKKRLEELSEHEEAYKAVEAAVTTGVSELKTVDLADINQKLNDKLTGMKDTLSVIEKGLLNASRQSQIDQLKRRAQNENERFMETVKNMLSDFRTKYPTTLQSLQQQVRTMLGSIKKFQDGGNYSPDEAKKFEQLLTKLIERTTQAEKSMGTECLQLELKRKTAVDMLVNKSLEKVPAHEADVEAIRVLTGVLAKAQAEIKKYAALVNTEYADVKTKMDYLKGVVGALRKNATTAGIDEEDVLVKLAGVLREMRACCGQLGCLGQSSLPGTTSTAHETPPISPTPTSRGIPSTQSARSANSTSQPPASKPEPVLVREPTVTSFSLASTRRSKIGAPLKPPPPVPTDFQLSTSDGPVPLAQPRILLPMDGRPITSSGPKTAASPAVGIKGNESLTEKKGSKKGKNLEKYNVFGDSVLPDARTFLERVHVVCWQTLDESLTFAEGYHQAKGTRPVTRPNLIPNTLEETAERVCRKLLNYMTQSEEFAAVMADRYREIASGSMDLIVELAPLLFRHLLGRFSQESALRSKLIKDKYVEDSKRICNPGQDIEDLGLPVHLIRQNDIHELLKFFIASNKASWMVELQTLSEAFLRKLNTAIEKLFKAADLLITSDEFQTPVAPPTLTIRAQSRRSLISSLDDPRRSTIGRTWKALDIHGVLENIEESVGCHDVSCEKTTMANLAVDDARHRVFAEFLQQFDTRKEEAAFFDVVRYKKPEIEQKGFIESQLKRLEILEKIHRAKEHI